MRILLIGRTGQLGGDLVRNNARHELIAPDRDELDVVDPMQVTTALGRYRPQLVINCAAFHNVPLCEQQPDLAFRVNCVAMRDLALACRDADARLVTFSSDYVFGSELALGKAISALAVVNYTIAFVCLAACLPAYRRAMAEAETWYRTKPS